MPLRILIVDDNEDHADSLAALVEMWGHVPTVAYDGESGWRAVREVVPDCLILDVSMPGIDGYTLADMIRHQPGLERAKLIAVSAYSHPDHVRRVREVGFDYHLTKPAPLDQLEGILKMIENIMRLTEKTEELTRKNVEVAERTEELAKQNVALAGETKDLLQDVKAGLEEVKQDVQEIKEEVHGIKEEVREVKDRVEKDPLQQQGEGDHEKKPTSK